LYAASVQPAVNVMRCVCLPDISDTNGVISASVSPADTSSGTPPANRTLGRSSPDYREQSP
jgi:hypothetical protein